MTEPIRLDLDRHQFAEWLRGLPPHAMVGERQCCATCPLAKFLAAMGAPRPEVQPHYYATDDLDPNTRRDTPTWAADFIEAIDGTPWTWDTAGSPTARECLEVLEAVC
jgi:hypothetical protein